MSIAMTGLVVTLLLTTAMELIDRLFFPRPVDRRSHWPRPALACGLILGAGAMGAIGPGGRGSVESGPSLLWLVIAAIPVFAAGLKTDYTRPATRRHFWATILGAVVLVIGGFGIPHLGVPGMGTVFLGTFGMLALTVAWTFIVVGILELCSLLPLLSGFIAILIGLSVWLPIDVRVTYSGLALSGCLVGGLLGHALGQLLKAESRSPEKADALVLGFFCAAATLTTFLKSVTLAGVILPFAVITIIVILVGMRSFERSLLLRASPRE